MLENSAEKIKICSVARQTGRRFSKVADAYQEYRPEYPQALYDLIVELCPPRPDSCLLDVGCGTGNVANALAQAYPKVYGLDPSPEMLHHASRHQPENHKPIAWLQGLAEMLPFSPGAIDLIAAGQSFHWFEPEAFFTEVKRVLKPGGLIALFGEGCAKGEPYRTHIWATADDYLGIERAGEFYQGESHDALVDELSQRGFCEAQQSVFKYDLEWIVESFVGFMNSSSRMAKFNPKQREELSARFRAVLQRLAGGDRFVEKNVAILITGR